MFYQVQKHFQWNSPPIRFDAFHLVMYDLWLRHHTIKYWYLDSLYETLILYTTYSFSNWEHCKYSQLQLFIQQMFFYILAPWTFQLICYLFVVRFFVRLKLLHDQAIELRQVQLLELFKIQTRTWVGSAFNYNTDSWYLTELDWLNILEKKWVHVLKNWAWR